MQRRRGWTLIEMIAVLFSGTAVLLASVALVHSMFDLQETGRTRWRERAVLTQLAQQFREDVHAAASASAAPTVASGKPSAWEWSLEGDLQVRYAADGERLTRTAMQQGRPVANQSFALPAATAASIDVPADLDGGIASLVIRQSGVVSGASPPVQPVRIEAAWGLNRRIAQGSAPSPVSAPAKPAIPAPAGPEKR